MLCSAFGEMAELLAGRFGRKAGRQRQGFGDGGWLAGPVSNAAAAAASGREIEDASHTGVAATYGRLGEPGRSFLASIVGWCDKSSTSGNHFLRSASPGCLP